MGQVHLVTSVKALPTKYKLWFFLIIPGAFAPPLLTLARSRYHLPTSPFDELFSTGQGYLVAFALLVAVWGELEIAQSRNLAREAYVVMVRVFVVSLLLVTAVLYVTVPETIIEALRRGWSAGPLAAPPKLDAWPCILLDSLAILAAVGAVIASEDPKKTSGRFVCPIAPNHSEQLEGVRMK